MDKIIIHGAKENNLKDIDIELPKNKLIVFTGVSGSGKSTLAFDTIFAEGQRRYMESLSSYARQFLGQMQKPNVESIEGLSPAISIDQKTRSNNPRSTVGTITEIYDYLRLLFAKIGVPYCPKCGAKIEMQTVDQIVDEIMKLPDGTKVIIIAPVIRGQKGTHAKFFENARADGFVRVEVDGEIRNLDEEFNLDKNKKHNISIVVDRLVIKEGIEKRVSDSVELSIKEAEGIVEVEHEGERDLFSTNYSCNKCNISFGEITPRLFSFNNPFGACPHCHGLGTEANINPNILIPDPKLSLNQKAINISGWNLNTSGFTQAYFEALSKHFNFSLDTPYCDLPQEIQHAILYGTNEEIEIVYENKMGTYKYSQKYEGVIPNLLRRYMETTSESQKKEIARYMTEVECPKCHGDRLKLEATCVRIANKNIVDICNMSIVKIVEFFNDLKLNTTQFTIASTIIKEITARLRFLLNVGLDYLTLSRASGSLSGGESQRIRLASQIGSGLTGVLYILDEPSIGLHQRDNMKLIESLKNLRDLGNTLIVVEHDEDTIRSADYIVDIGPHAGVNGGQVVASGTLEDIMNCSNSIAGQYLSGKKKIEVPQVRRSIKGDTITLYGCKQNNLKNIDVKFVKGVLNVVTGVSGGGKSSLVMETLYPVLYNIVNRAFLPVGKLDKIEGTETINKVIMIDQNPIGRTPRSNPATYCGVFDEIRNLFAQTVDAKERGYKSGRFSFNISGGRCEACGGEGIKKIEMYFLPDVYVPCEVCKGKRYNRETLEVKFKGKTIFDVLNMTVEEALAFFKNFPIIRNKIQTLFDVGLGYIKLGQSATTLSGGEAQRVKLATELSKRGTGNTLYLLDEPTTGLATDDVSKLISILQRLVGTGNTVVVIEHNLDVIKVADNIIDIGPEGGDKGGQLVACGTPEDVAKNKKSWTGQFLKPLLEKK